MNEQSPQRFNPQALANMESSSGAMPAAWVPRDFGGLMEISKLMAQSGAAVPKHLRQNPGMCLSVAMVAYQNGFNPFLLSADSFVVNDILAFGSKAIGAMVNNSPKLDGRLHFDLDGTWPKRVCVVTGRIKGDRASKVLTINAETITTRNSPLWKQQPDQQLIYWSQRAWARVYMPEVLLGLMDAEEASSDDHHGPDNARDVTPAARASDKPKGAAKAAQKTAAEPVATVIDVEPDTGMESTAPAPEPEPEQEAPQETAQAEPEVLAPEPTQDQPTAAGSDLVDEKGEIVGTFETAEDWIDAFKQVAQGAPTAEAVKTIWESNSAIAYDLLPEPDYEAVQFFARNTYTTKLPPKKTKAADPAPEQQSEPEPNASTDSAWFVPPVIVNSKSDPMAWYKAASDKLMEATEPAHFIEFDKVNTASLQELKAKAAGWFRQITTKIAKGKEGL